MRLRRCPNMEQTTATGMTRRGKLIGTVSAHNGTLRAHEALAMRPQARLTPAAPIEQRTIANRGGLHCRATVLVRLTTPFVELDLAQANRSSIKAARLMNPRIERSGVAVTDMVAIILQPAHRCELSRPVISHA